MASGYAKDQPAGFVNHIKNVAIVGASGQLGTHITSALVKAGKHTITAITRPDSKNEQPSSGVKVVKVDYDDHTALISALQGQDALVITMNVLAPKDSIEKLVKAALEAKVPWILPNEWGSDYTDEAINRDTQLGPEKLAIRDLIQTQGAPHSTWIAVACGFWYDYSLAVGPEITFGFDFTRRNIAFFDGGSFKLRYSTLPYCGEAVAKLLSLPVLPADQNEHGVTTLSEYRNAICRVHAFTLDQRDMLASVLRVTGDKESDWTVEQTTAAARYEEGKRTFEGGEIMGWRQMLYSRWFYPSNEVKGLEDYSDEKLGLAKPNLDEATKWALDQINKEKTA